MSTSSHPGTSPSLRALVRQFFHALSAGAAIVSVYYILEPVWRGAPGAAQARRDAGRLEAVSWLAMVLVAIRFFGDARVYALSSDRATDALPCGLARFTCSLFRELSS